MPKLKTLLTSRFLFIFLALFIRQNCDAQISVVSVSPDDKGLYYLGTATLSAINISTTTGNVLKIRKNEKDKYKSNAIFWILFGSVQTAFGLVNENQIKFKNDKLPRALNIGIGLSSVVTSVIRLARKYPKKENNMSFNFSYHPPAGLNSQFAVLTIKLSLK